MSEEGWIDLQRQQDVLGFYSMNNFYMWAGSYADLDLIDTIEDEDRLSLSVGVHAHEYTHFLHNISTASGAAIFTAKIWLLRAMASCTDHTGYSMGNGDFNEEQRKLALAATTLMDSVLGLPPWKDGEGARLKPVRWEFKQVVRNKLVVEAPPTEIRIEVAEINGVAFDREGNDHDFSLRIGYNLISEGIAYEVEREVRQNNNEPPGEIDRETPTYPYLAYQPLVEYFLGRSTTARERVYIGIMALQDSSPSIGLLNACNHFKDHPIDESQLSENSGALDEKTSKRLAALMDDAITAIKAPGNGEWGGDDVRALFNQGFELRGRYGMLELAFMKGALSVEAFRQLQGSMIDCCVIQQKDVDRAEGYWVGPGVVAKDPASQGRLGSFIAALHFAGLHTKRFGKLIATSELPEKKCPFSGMCPIESQDRMPDDCKSKPWRRFHGAPLDQPACWYATGVRMFIKNRSKPTTG